MASFPYTCLQMHCSKASKLLCNEISKKETSNQFRKLDQKTKALHIEEIERHDSFVLVTLTFPLFITMSFFSHSWKAVSEDEEADFNYLEQEIHTNSSTKLYTVEHLQPYTVYSFQVAAVNHVGRSRPSKNSYPSITLRESKFSSQEYNIYHSGLFG